MEKMYTQKGARRSGLKLLLLGGMLSFVLWCEGQTFAFQHYTDREGLPSRYMYDLDQDSDGYIWMTGEAGMVWYDGIEYNTPVIQAEFNDEIIRLYRDDNRCMWMQDLAGNISLYRNGKYQLFPEIEPPLSYAFVNLFSFSKGEVWIANTKGVYIYDYISDSLYQKNIGKVDDQLAGVKVFHIDTDGNLLLLTEEGFYRFENGKSNYHIYGNDVRINSDATTFNVDGQSIILMKDGFYTFSTNSLVIIPELQQHLEVASKLITDIYQDRNQDLWMTTKNGLVYLEQQDNGYYKRSEHLPGEIMGAILEDFEGNMWFTTNQNGVFKLPSKQVKVYEFNGTAQQLRFIEENRKGEFVLGFDNNEYEVLDDQLRTKYQGKLHEQNHRLYDFAQDAFGNQYFFTSWGYIQFDENFKLQSYSKNWSLKAGTFTSDGTFWIAGANFISQAINLSEKKDLIYKRTYFIYPIANEELWFGTIYGPIHYQSGEFHTLPHPELQIDIRDIKEASNGHLLFATQKDGLFVYDPQSDSIVYHLTSDNGLSSNFCSSLLLDDNFIWLTTKGGLNRINWSDYSNTIFGIDQGIPSNEINGILKKDGFFYLATNKGMAVFDEHIALDKKPPRLKVVNIRIAEKDTIVQNIYSLDHYDNNIKIDFNGITFKNASSLSYEYKMEGIDADWISSRVGMAQYPSLPSGSYTFLARAKTKNTNWSEIKQISFYIKRPFWATWWALTLAGIFIIGVIYAVFWDVKRRGKLKNDLKTSQLTALRAQMNPHFVFNALNSIQEFIVRRDTRSANRYLSQFAKLMRNVLNVSDKDRINLDKEIGTLKLYLSLEALRFGSHFEYVFELEEDMDKDALFLPPMLIQPFVENAIKHGLMHRSGSKKLFIRFFTKADYLICEIEDNGIGREKSQEIRKNNPRLYSSKSTSLTHERLKVFNSNYKGALQLRIIDLKEKGKALGTKVEIKIRKHYDRGILFTAK